MKIANLAEATKTTKQIYSAAALLVANIQLFQLRAELLQPIPEMFTERVFYSSEVLAGWLDEKLNFDTFWHQHIPAAYIFMADDQAVDQSIYHTMAARLDNPITTTIPGSHEVILVYPDVLADAIVKVSLPISPVHL